MPIEIREMYINVKVNYGNAPSANAPVKSKKKEKEEEDTKELVEEYCEAVIDTINNKKER